MTRILLTTDKLPVYTAWKRVYEELTQIFYAGWPEGGSMLRPGKVWCHITVILHKISRLSASFVKVVQKSSSVNMKMFCIWGRCA
uniref:Uncharacterized protein n=1 Tax=Magnetococcus massalia (strain MO-1) TaxID=451514 RepID=A0A1S7LNE9_MAGMO|nr:protein of unknown function [Candidatus Magnetococcus massalia]